MINIKHLADANPILSVHAIPIKPMSKNIKVTKECIRRDAT